ncbi:DNA repair protein rhp26 [Histomonas meleagridis]|uniref:DNA repair protein rhp26 n=1 Tax=Histomonas meleagridis TaxID=135588 RepID=UPI003559E6A0|nr:DNA repair protein rhp26 [Histomonas meleagridis]KAH0802193.1 DNA repair protein rhp26 [Histomonas meleagridis]
MSEEEDTSDIDFGKIVNMGEYEAEVVNSMEQKENEETNQDSESSIEDIKKNLAQARRSGNKKDIEKYEKKLADEKIKAKLPKNLNVEIERVTDTSENNSQMPEISEELNKYWHYKVMHTSFVGEDSINLTVDDSDPEVFDSRNNFIRDHCEPYLEMHDIDEELHIPKAIWDSLFPHQRVAVEWLWGLWKKQAGGIEGDEMGLGKTAIACTFINALHTSNIIHKPILILCPLTVAQQWIRELHIWCPLMHSILLHSTRSNQKVTPEEIIQNVEGNPSIIVTNYEFLHHEEGSMLLQLVDWSIVMCDEGHKIRNYQSSISRNVKKLTSDFKLVISGSPIQNNLLELWSLFDFAVPGLLGTLEVFQQDFADPIKYGGYSNATPITVYRAYHAAITLRDLIKPYLLRRLKKDVAANLPSKTEQIFFVNLTEIQERCYRQFLDSPLCRDIIRGTGEFFTGIDFLRKICNHPALTDDDNVSTNLDNSSKLKLLKKLLPQWKRHNHRVLLFSQYLRMLDLLELLFQSLNLTYFRIDGETQTNKRIHIMDRFNNGECFACLLSTKVGGVGVNLIGADKVVIIDPDWNPANDNQALERAWRIGQTKPVSVYRLITIGTIEEKMYKKQIFKQFLANKILKSPNQKNIFKSQTVRDLFTLNTTGATIDDLSYYNDDEIVDDEENEDEEDEDDDKRITETFINNGDIKRIINHDELINDNNTNQRPENVVASERAKEQNKRALMRLQKNNTFMKDLVSRVRGSNEIDEEILIDLKDKILNLFKKNGNKITTNDIIRALEKDQSAKKNEKTVKYLIRQMAVLNKRTHTWVLKHKYNL